MDLLEMKRMVVVGDVDGGGTDGVVADGGGVGGDDGSVNDDRGGVNDDRGDVSGSSDVIDDGNGGGADGIYSWCRW